MDHETQDPAPFDPPPGEPHKHAAPVDQRLVTMRRHRRRAVYAFVIGLLIITALQLSAPSTDYQYSNMASLLVGAISVLVMVYQFHRIARTHGHRFIVPAVFFGLIALLVILLEFDGFSGEMIPHFKFRFGESPHTLRELPDNASQPLASGDGTASEVLPADALGLTDADPMAAASTQFFGGTRTGVQQQREFAIPESEASVKVLWDQGIGEGWASFAVEDGRAVTLEQRDDMDCVTCYRLADGELLWVQSDPARHAQIPGGIGPRSTPTIHNGRVYAQNATGLLWCIELESGKSIWTADLVEMAGWTVEQSEEAITWGRAASPLLVDGLCVIPYGGPELNASTGRTLIAFDAESGEVRWISGEDQISYASPGVMNLAGQRQIVSVNENTITGHEIESGDVLWSFPWPGQSNAAANCATAVPAGDDRLLIGKGYAGGSSLIEIKRQGDGDWVAQEVWHSSRFFKTKFTHACVLGGIGYAISNGALEAVDVEQSKRLWAQPRSSRFGQGQILVAEDTIVAQAEEGDIVFVAVDDKQYKELGRLEGLGAKTWNIPTLAGRYLLIRNDRQAICYLLPPRAE